MTDLIQIHQFCHALFYNLVWYSSMKLYCMSRFMEPPPRSGKSMVPFLQRLSLYSHTYSPGNHWSVLHHFFENVIQVESYLLRLVFLTQYSEWPWDPSEMFMYQQSAPFYHRLVFHCLGVPQFVYPFTPRKTFGLLSNSRLLQESCYKDSGTFRVGMFSFLKGQIPESVIAESLY